MSSGHNNKVVLRTGMDRSSLLALKRGKKGYYSTRPGGNVRNRASVDSKKEEELHSQAYSSVSSARRSKTRVFAKRARRDAHVDEKILCRRAVVVENDLRDCVEGHRSSARKTQR